MEVFYICSCFVFERSCLCRLYGDYDDHGNVTESDLYGQTRSYSYTYYDNGKIKTMVYTDYYGTREETYDEKGRQLSQVNKNLDGNITSGYRYEYDSKGQ